MTSASDLNGRALEYACITALYHAIISHRRVCTIEDSPQYRNIEAAYHQVSPEMRNRFDTAANAMLDKIFDCEPMLKAPGCDRLQLMIQPDSAGEEGDVRDVVVIRAERDWEIGFSIKHNHFAVKHSRLSPNIDFGNKWFGVPCTQYYWDDVLPIFDRLQDERAAGLNWSDLPDKVEGIYIPLLTAFMDEMERLYNSHPDIPERMVEYLLGMYDFYKIVSADRSQSTIIECFNIHGDLNLPAGDFVPYLEVPIAELPHRILNIDFKPGSDNTVEIYLDNGWAFSFRIHNASTRVESSLKFDIQMISVPVAIMTINCVW